jgi:hypothetical protein
MTQHQHSLQEKKIYLFSAIIAGSVDAVTHLDVLCHHTPYYNKKDYVPKVSAEVIASFNSTIQTLHEHLSPKLADL